MRFRSPSFLVILLMIFPICGLADSAEPFLIEKGIALTETVAGMASNDFLSLFGDSLASAESASKVAGLSELEPTGATFIQPSIEVLLPLLADELDFTLENMSEDVRAQLSQKVSTFLATTLNSLEGAEHLALSSVLTASKSYPAPDSFASTILILHYADAACDSVISFTETGEGIITASAMPLFARNAVETFAELQSVLLTDQVQITHYSQEQLPR